MSGQAIRWCTPLSDEQQRWPSGSTSIAKQNESKRCKQHMKCLGFCGQGRVRDDMTALSGWANFYVIVGSAAGALIGLQFVVLSLISSRPMAQDAHEDAAEAGDAFSTPTIVHFGAVLGLSGILSAPWDGIGTV